MPVSISGASNVLFALSTIKHRRPLKPPFVTTKRIPSFAHIWTVQIAPMGATVHVIPGEHVSQGGAASIFVIDVGKVVHPPSSRLMERGASKTVRTWKRNIGPSRHNARARARECDVRCPDARARLSSRPSLSFHSEAIGLMLLLSATSTRANRGPGLFSRSQLSSRSDLGQALRADYSEEGARGRSLGIGTRRPSSLPYSLLALSSPDRRSMLGQRTSKVVERVNVPQPTAHAPFSFSLHPELNAICQPPYSSLAFSHCNP
ncbi:hypothetical protein PUNSTDRAFT_134286 [Punctularia strigosozonata HHB-11173 SS5]|uniref:uncharacterized protein n=1 Tax=Punctularia strigosozonata (strain HHB-11173) TaxID=741275 RepID=UPI000441634D|nr:uncharacterized protein PUNSTDRAFT_134286 [Punctularia strigosozonata HHB-11173 SS5]EIN09119.1 hypothetical protein PUNSTDRAFT_134286 [Punctularia strigosozonata HHB-11173 SS5]